MELKGLAVSAGIAIGSAYVYEAYQPSVPDGGPSAHSADVELALYETALSRAADELDCLAAENAGSRATAEIFQAHRAILTDVELDDMVRQAVTEGSSAARAVYDAFSAFMEILSASENPVFRERAADLEDVRARLLRCLCGGSAPDLSALQEGVVLVCEDLLPSETALLRPGSVAAILTARGGFASHTAILARSAGIPAILGVSGLLDGVRTGMPLIVDAERGVVYIEPSEQELAVGTQRLQSFLTEREQDAAYLRRPAALGDGTRIELMLNIGSLTDAERRVLPWTDGAGLFRTEFLYMENTHLPDEEEQFSAYKAALAAFSDRPVVLRTLDIGGDKQLPYLKLPKEDNPFLGVRALRLCLQRPELFHTQLRAALRASRYGQIRIMVPMVSSLEEIEAARIALSRAAESLERDGIPYERNVPFGIMIEIPSIALIADQAAHAVDFASIGTNDLCQYLTASDRMNPDVSASYDTCHPGMLRLIRYTADAFSAAGKHLCVCGEMAGDPGLAVLLSGLGVRALSMGASSVARVKRALAGIDAETARRVADTACAAPTAARVRAILNDAIGNGSVPV